MIRKIFLLLLVAATSQVYGTYPFGGSQFGTHPYGTQAALPPQYTPAGPAGAETSSFGRAQPISNPHTPIAPYHTHAVDRAVRVFKKDLYHHLSGEANEKLTMDQIWSGKAIRKKPEIGVDEVQRLRNALESHNESKYPRVILTYEQLTDILAWQQKEAHDKLVGKLTGIPSACILRTGEIEYSYVRGSQDDPICQRPVSDLWRRLKMLPEAHACYYMKQGGIVMIKKNKEDTDCAATNGMSGAIEYGFLNGDIDYKEMLSLEAHNRFGNIAKHRRIERGERSAPSQMGTRAVLYPQLWSTPSR